MKKEIREADVERGIIQVTIADERWYLKSKLNDLTGIPEYEGVPSVTWITQSYPKGIAYFKWLADKGWDESESIKTAAGEKGSKVHLAIEAVLRGEEVRIDSKFLNKNTGQLEEVTLEESDCILSFVSWKNMMEQQYVIDTISSERTIFSTKYGYAGTIDWIVRLTGIETKVVTYWIVDFKTSQQVWPSHELQLAAYKHSMVEMENVPDELKNVPPNELNLAVLQVGYRRSKQGYKWNVVDDKFHLFLAARTIWENDHGGEQPNKKDYPVVLSPKRETGDAADPVFVSTLSEEAKTVIKTARTKARNAQEEPKVEVPDLFAEKK